MANLDRVTTPDGQTYNIVDSTSGYVTSAYVQAQIDTINKNTIGLGNVDNTSDLNKPISTATQAALDAKVNKSGDTMTGDLTLDSHSGTSGVLGETILTIGNNISQGVEGNSLGRLDIYGNGQYRSRLNCDTLSANRNIKLPDKTGTIALTDDFGWGSAVNVNLNSGTASFQKHALLGLKRVSIVANQMPATNTVLSNKIPEAYEPSQATLGSFFDNNGNSRSVLLYADRSIGIGVGSTTGLVGEYLYW